MSGHTPGPWEVDPHRPPMVKPPKGLTVSTSPYGGDRSYAEACANARLIAAAPAMLAALEEFIAAWHDDDGFEAAFIAAEEAIALARDGEGA